MSAGFRLVNTKCMMLVDMWKKIQHSNAVTLREVFTTKAFGDHCTYSYLCLRVVTDVIKAHGEILPNFIAPALVFSYDFHAGAETMFSRHFNDPAADSYFTKRKWGEFVFSLFFGPTVFCPLLHFDYQSSISSICALFLFFAACSNFFLKCFHCLCLPAAFNVLCTNSAQSRERQTHRLLRMFWLKSVYFWQLAYVRFFASVIGGGLEETVAETKPVAGAIWPTYRNT